MPMLSCGVRNHVPTMYSSEDLLALRSGYIVTYIVHGLLLGFAKRLIIPANSPNIGRWGLGLGRAIE